MTKWFWPVGLLLLMMQGLLGCSGDSQTGPMDVKWDRETCERCRMVLSDRHYATQVRVFPEGKRAKVFYFDDIGCAALWLADKPWWEDSPNTEIWVADHHSGDWIDARTATYIRDKLTPMQYGLGAQSDPDPSGMDFKAAKRHVVEVEQHSASRSAQLLKQLKEMGAKRAATQEDKP